MRYVLDQLDREWSKRSVVEFQPTSKAVRDRLMTIPLRVLVLEDSPTDAAVMLEHLRQAGYAPDWRRVETEADYLANLEPTLDLILLDYTLPNFTGRQALQLLQDRRLDIPAIIVTGTVSEETALECLRFGAADYLLKDRLTRLGEAVRGALAQRALRQERAAAEEARQASEARARFLADVLEQCAQPFAVTLPSGRLGIFNAAFCTLVGYTGAELRSLDWSRDLTPPEWHAFEARYLAELHRTGHPVRYEKEFHRKDGSRVPVELLVHLVRGTADALLYYYAFITDLSERERAEQDLAIRTRQLEAVRTVSQEITRELDLTEVLQLICRRAAELVGDGAVAVYLWDNKAEFLVQKASSGSEDLTLRRLPVRLGEGLVGKVAQRREGMLVNEYRTWPSARPEILERTNLTAVLAEPLLYRGRLVGVIVLDNRDTGRSFKEQDRAILRLLADQAAIAIENARLYAELNESYQNLLKTQDELVRAEKLRALGEMATGVAHDLNNTLAAILGQTELLQLQVTDPAILESLTILEGAATDGAAVVRRLQEFARQRARSVLAPLDLAPLVQEALEITRPRWKDDPQRRGAVIQVETALDALPAVMGHGAEICEALTNLILNAVDAMPQGGVLNIAGSPVPGGVALAMTDSGVGMTEAIRKKMFDPFFTTKGIQGSGLGLSVVYGIMERHGGRIEVTSAPGKGTTVTLLFAAADGSIIASQAPTVNQHAPRRVLVVDDEPTVRQTLADLLRAAGHTVIEAESGAAGLGALESSPVDLVLSDLGMPEMTGWDVARAIKATTPATPVILLTGWGDQLVGETGGREAVDRVLGKPVRLKDLLAAIAELTGPPQS
jgi:PAS domain S-box-containing protein